MALTLAQATAQLKSKQSSRWASWVIRHPYPRCWALSMNAKRGVLGWEITRDNVTYL